MDIQLSKNLQQPSLAISKTELLNLKINQQLEVKVISSKADLQSLMLEISQSAKTIQVQSNQNFEAKPGQTLQLVVTKLVPVVEFKVIAIDGEKTTTLDQQKTDVKPETIKDTILKQIITKTESPVSNTQQKAITSVASKLAPISSPTIINAKIISISNGAVQIKLYTKPTPETAAYTKKNSTTILQQHNPVIQLKLTQLKSAHIQPIKINSGSPVTITDGKLVTTAMATNPGTQQTTSNNNPTTVTSLHSNPPKTQSKAIQPLTTGQSYKPGQSIQFEVNRAEQTIELKIPDKPKLSLIHGQIISAKVIAYKGEQIQLAIQLPALKPTDTSGKPLPSLVSKTADTQTKTISLSTKQISSSSDKSIPTATFKVDQSLNLQVTKTGSNPEFKLLETTQAKLNTGQVVTAKVIEVKNNKIQLQLQLPPTSNNVKPLPADNKQNIEHSFITLDKGQLHSSVTTKPNQSSNTPVSAVDIHTIKPGQLIKLEVTKTGAHAEFTLLQNKPAENLDVKILQTIKQVLPIHAPPSETVNQMIKSLPLLNKNEKIPAALKRIAREIMNSIPDAKDLKNPKQLKQSIRQSGLFLEAKLASSGEKIDSTLQTDFKNQLLKMQHNLKQEVSVKTEQNNQSSELSLLKEMQQKTESSLARVILNQLTSLPKDEGQRQIWVVDLPFIHKENAESVKIEINREHGSDNNQQEENWSVDITITPPELATIHCKVSCFDKTISTRFWSDDQHLVNNITQNLNYLKTQFEKAGITPGSLSAHMGVATKEPHQQLAGQNLFNQKV